jgi:hypothetical protein
MRIRTIVILGASTFLVTACGSAGGTAASAPRPPSPVNLTVLVNDSRVSVSPNRLGAGPVIFIVTNQATRAESLAISTTGHTRPLASTAPINPQGTTQVSLDFKPGVYTVATESRRATDAQRSRPPTITPASIHIGRRRASSNSELLQP